MVAYYDKGFPFVGSAMEISAREDYALRAMLHLFRHGHGSLTTIKEIAEEQDIPPAYLARIIRDLARAGLVRCYRGITGGVALIAKPDQLSLRQVLEAVSGPLALRDCQAKARGCERKETCPFYPVWSRIQRLVLDELSRIKFSELLTS